MTERLVVARDSGNTAFRGAVETLSTEQTACNLCGAAEAEALFRETYCLEEAEVELCIVRCKRCGLVYVSPRLTLESTTLVYEQDAERTVSHSYCWDGESDDSRYRRLLRRLAEMQPEGRLLDVGCGVGHFLATARRMGKWEALGVEPSSVAEQARRSAECQVYQSTLEEAPLELGAFDIVTMFAVLEHLHDPRRTLRRACELLKPSGLLAVYVPNFHYLRLKDTGPVAQLRLGRWSNLHPQEHLFQFTPRTLQMLLEAEGFRMIDLDIGRPYYHGGAIERWSKFVAYHGVRGLWKLMGIHLGGIEAIARRVDDLDSPRPGDAVN